MKTIAAEEFKTNCLAVTDEVEARREAVVITKHGHPVAKLVPMDKRGARHQIFGFFSGKGSITGDVASPAFSRRGWGNLK